jgi:transmembrane sensor
MKVPRGGMTQSRNNSDRPSIEAARWLVALEEQPDDAALRARFVAWRDASPANAAAWTDTTHVYALMGQLPAVPVAAPQRNFRRRVGLGLAGAAIAACLAYLVVPSLVLRVQADHRTQTAELRSVRLDDGSVVHLGPESAVAVRYAAQERRVQLLKGEAFFDVTPDADRPFRVGARDIETTVLGTAFSVRLGDEAAAIGVRHGRVRVDQREAQPPRSETLGAGEWIRLPWQGQAHRGTVPVADVAAWVDGQIVARDRPMADVVDELRAYYAGLIVLTDTALGQQRITGVYNIADPVAALTAIAGAHGGSVRQFSSWVLVVGAR